MIGQYELMLAQQEGPTITEQGYGGAFNATHDDASIDDSTGSIIASVTKYAERASAAEAEVADLKSAMSGLQQQFAAMMTGQMQAANFAP